MNGNDYTIIAREYKDEKPDVTAVDFSMHYRSEDRKSVRYVDDCLSALCQRLNEGDFDGFNKFIEVVEAWLEGGDEGK